MVRNSILLLVLCTILGVYGNEDSNTRLSATEASTAESTSQVPHQVLPKSRLREGASIVNHVGKLTMIGKRWIFIPEPAVSATESRMTGGIASSKNTNKTAMAMHDSTEPPQSQSIPNLTIAENLMLERIVSAIRADPADDRWSITGRLTEFFDDNGVVITYARRAPLGIESTAVSPQSPAR
jgi:hypothetical protein